MQKPPVRPRFVSFQEQKILSWSNQHLHSHLIFMETLINPTSIQADVPSHAWTTVQKILFRFFCIYFLLYVLINNNGALPGFEYIVEHTLNPVLHSIIPWVGKYLLHLSYDITVFTNGSGDTTYDYVLVLALFVVAVIGCIIWSLLDRHRTDYNIAYYWLLVVVRYYLALSMLQYGFAKVFYLQFSFPGQSRLLQPYGESSPMGLAWTFMGYSRLYNYFTGFAEVLGGTLLLFRRTTAIGSILTLIVMTNVAMMNFCYDIPVKLLSTHMVGMCLFILAPNFQRFYDFFILHRTALIPLPQAPVFRKKALNITLTVFKYVLIVGSFASVIIFGLQAQKQYGADVPKPPLHGIYNTELFVWNGDTLPPLLSDTVRWRRMIVGQRGDVSLRSMADSLNYYQFKADTLKKQFEIVSYSDSTQKYTFHYSVPEKDKLVVQGKWKEDSVQVQFKKYNTDQFKLVNRGFNWINEYPFNR